MVSKEHIDVLVTASIALGIIPKDEADMTGIQLWDENWKSINSRYPDTIDDHESIPGPISFRPEHIAEYTFDPRPTEDLIYVYKQAGCYGYQSCEHDEWKDSTAFRITGEIETEILKHTGLTEASIQNHPLYKKATWGVHIKEDGSLWLDSNEFYAWCRIQNGVDQ
jgi:hypothetical protein